MPLPTNRLSVNGTPQQQESEPSLAERDRKANEALASRYDTIGQLWLLAEKKMKALKPPSSVWIEYNHQSDEYHPCEWELLGLTKHNGHWRICHGHDHELNDEWGVMNISPIVECSAQVRIEAAEHLPALHDAIIKSKEQSVAAAEKTIAAMTNFLAEI